MKYAKIPVIGFAAYSGTGKTTLLIQLIPLLKKKGVRVGIIKHSHHDFEIDKPGKDSFRLRSAGADSVLLVSQYRRAVITEFSGYSEPKLDEQLAIFDQSELDLILVEGFREERFPKIELHRPILNKPLLFPGDPTVIAIATDRPVHIPEGLVQLDLNDVSQITEFILLRFLKISP